MDTFTKIEQAGYNTAKNPSQAQAVANNYKKGRVTLHGLAIAIENPRNSERRGVDPSGKAWVNRMAAHYGHFEKYKGADGDGLDVFIGLIPESQAVFIINQLDPATKLFDEHKVMLGFPDWDAAKKAYLNSYDHGWRGLGDYIACDIEQFAWWLKHGNKNMAVKPSSIPNNGNDNMANETSWDSTANPVGMDLTELMYRIRLEDRDNELLDSVGADLLAHLGELTTIDLDALVVPMGKLEAKMKKWQVVMNGVSDGVQVSAVQVTAPFKQRGTTNVAAVFELSDGQAVTIVFHNPDATPNKITVTDELVSWKWMLNKKDVTIVVAPEQGADLNPREVARRIMRLAEKNSARFQKINTARAEAMKEIEGLKLRLDQGTATLASLDAEIAELQAKVDAIPSLPKPSKYSDGSAGRDIELEIEQLSALGVADITNIGSENIYIKKNGLHYYSKVMNTEDYAEGEWDFSQFPNGRKATANPVALPSNVSQEQAVPQKGDTFSISGMNKDGTWHDIVLNEKTEAIALKKLAEYANRPMGAEMLGSFKSVAWYYRPQHKFGAVIDVSQYINAAQPAPATVSSEPEKPQVFAKNVKDSWPEMDHFGLTATQAAVLLNSGINFGGYGNKQQKAETEFGVLESDYSKALADLVAKGLVNGKANATTQGMEVIGKLADELVRVAFLRIGDAEKKDKSLVFTANGRARWMLTGYVDAESQATVAPDPVSEQPAAVATDDPEQAPYSKFDWSQVKMPTAIQLGFKNPRIRKSFVEGGGWTNGHLLDISSVPSVAVGGFEKYEPEATTMQKSGTVEKIVKDAKSAATTLVEPIASYDVYADKTDKKNAASDMKLAAIAALQGKPTQDLNAFVLANQDAGLAVQIDKRYFGYFAKTYKGAEFYAPADGNGAIVVKKNGVVVGVVMPIKGADANTLKRAKIAAGKAGGEQAPIAASSEQKPKIFDLSTDDYAEAKAIKEEAWSQSEEFNKPLEAFPKGAMGLTPDDVKNSPEWQTAKRNFDIAFEEMRRVNAWFNKKFDKEYKAERRANNATQEQAKAQSPVSSVDAAYEFNASDEFKEWLAESVDKPDYSPFATAKAMTEAAKKHGATIEWGFFGGATMDSVKVPPFKAPKTATVMDSVKASLLAPPYKVKTVPK